MRSLVALLLLLGCAAETVAPVRVTALRCSGALPGSPLTFVYRAEVLDGEPTNASVDVFAAGLRGSGSSPTADVTADLDWRGESNGGVLVFFPLGATLAVEYHDGDGNTYWSLPGCFDAL